MLLHGELRHRMTTYRARPGQAAYGYAIGVLCAQWHIPFIPGDLNNATTFPFPVRYLSVPGVVGAGVLNGQDPAFGDRLVQAARQLEAEGVRAITSNCGFMLAYQEEVSNAVDIPVFMSSLQQARMVMSMLGERSKLAVVVANTASLTPTLMKLADLNLQDRVVIRGLEDQPHWNECILQERGVLDEDLIRSEVVATVEAMVREEPQLGAVLLECSDLPPYADAVGRATGLPVFDWVGFVHYVYRSVVPQRYDGLF